MIIKQKKLLIFSLFVGVFILYSILYGWTYTFDTATPAGTDDPREADDRMREIKQAIQERLAAEHYFELSGTQVSGATAGTHKAITCDGLTTTNLITAGSITTGTLVVSGTASVAELVYDILYLDTAVLSNNTYLKSYNSTSGATVDMIKVNSAGSVTVADGAELASSGSPTTDASITNKKYVDDQIGGISTWTTSWSSAYSSTSPTSWTDLDLSGTVGAKNCLVFLKIVGSGNTNFYFRTNGDTTDYSAATTYGANFTTNYGYVMVETDSSGIIEWKANGTVSTAITLIGYISG